MILVSEYRCKLKFIIFKIFIYFSLQIKKKKLQSLLFNYINFLFTCKLYFLIDK